MGKITGFLEFEREDRDYEPVEARIKHWHEFVLPLPEEETTQAGGALHGLRHSVLPRLECGHRRADRLPGQQPDPGLERPGLSRPLAGGRAQPALDQQFPGSDRPRLPGAVRGVLHAQHRRQPGHHQDDRMRDRRPRLRAGLGEAGAAEHQDRQEGRRRRLGSGRHGLRAAARARRPRRARVREIRQGRRPDALRHPRLQDGEALRRPPRQPDGGGGRHLPLRRACRRECSGGEASGRARRGRADGRRREGARPADPGPRPQGHPLRHGVPAAAEPARERGSRRRHASRSSPPASTSW